MIGRQLEIARKVFPLFRGEKIADVLPVCVAAIHAIIGALEDQEEREAVLSLVMGALQDNDELQM
jgi:hypothetical protein